MKTTTFCRGRLVLLVLLSIVLFSTYAQCDSITIGFPASAVNIAPFGRLPSSPGANRYQQAYASADFTNLGPISISSIDFTGGNGGNFAPGTYDLYFSSITGGIDSLSDTSFDSNLGANNTLFTSVYLSGASPANLTFTGAPFLYDPSDGNLLLDIMISQDGPQPSGRIAGYLLNGHADGVFSRYDNFATGNIGFGLITQFDFTPIPEPSIAALVTLSLAVTIIFHRSKREKVA